MRRYLALIDTGSDFQEVYFESSFKAGSKGNVDDLKSYLQTHFGYKSRNRRVVKIERVV